MQYKGWTIEPVEGEQVGYRTATGRRGKGRKVRGYAVTHPEYIPPPNFKLCNTLRDAKIYVDGWEV